MNDSPEVSSDEVNIPQKNRLSRLFLLVGCVGLLVYLAHSWKSNQPLAEINVNGTEALTSDEVLKNIDSSFRNQPAEEVQLIQLQSAIEKNPLVKSAVAERRGVRGIEINVEERLPVAALVQGDGSTILIDDEAKVLPFIRFAARANVPLIRGAIERGKIDTVVLKDALAILKNIGSSSFAQAVSEVAFSKKAGTFSIISESGVDIFLGKSEVLPVTLQKLRGLFKNQIFNGSILRKSEYIDLQWEGRIITKPRKNDA